MTTEGNPRQLQLPDLPSALIRVALADLRAVEQDERYIIDMDHWHMPIRGTMLPRFVEIAEKQQRPKATCAVCLAGAIMARCFNQPGIDVMPSGTWFEAQTAERLEALNEFRVGNIVEGFRMWGYGIDVLATIEDTRFPHDVLFIIPYRHDRERFYAGMAKLADKLEEIGY